MRKQMAVKIAKGGTKLTQSIKGCKDIKSHFNFSLNCANQPKSKKVSKHVEPNSINFKKTINIFTYVPK